MTADPHRWRPQPVLVTRPQDVVACRGMRMGYAPLLQLLEPAIAAGHRRLAVIGVPLPGLRAARSAGRVGAGAALRHRHAVLGQHVDRELPRSSCRADRPAPESITYLEFRADYHVELRYADGRVRTIPSAVTTVATAA
jgi:coenzyme F420 hydrogenase subunit beta